MTNQDILIKMYERLHKNPDDQLKGLPLFHSSVIYATQAIKALFNREYSYMEVAKMMVEEGVLNRQGNPVKMRDLLTNLDNI